ncbi:MAG: M4 family metallopeptidase, partial [Chitinophagales bacterium]
MRQLIFIFSLLFVFQLITAQNKQTLQQIATTKSTSDWMVLKPDTRFQIQDFTEVTVNKSNKNLRKALGLKSEDALQFVKKTKKDRLGFTLHRLQQTYKGIKIEGAEYLLHEKNGSIQKANGRLIYDLNMAVKPAITSKTALEKALSYIDAQEYAWQNEGIEMMLQYAKDDHTATFYPESELVIVSPTFNRNAQDYCLAYKFNIYALNPLKKVDVYIDAQNGNLITELSKLYDADTNCTGDTHFSGTVNMTVDFDGAIYKLKNSIGGGIETFDLQNTIAFDTSTLVTHNQCYFDNHLEAVEAHWGTEQVYQYFLQKHNRQSFDDNNAKIMSWVNYEEDYNNAFWNGSWMTYGGGNGVQYNSFTSMDVIGHEISHAVTEYSAGLIYAWEAGALNESFSDIFGVVIDYFAKPNDANWLIGEEVTANGSGLDGLGFRSMANPNTFNHPDTYEGNNWRKQVGCYANPFNDYCGVHRNSSVQNHWFYLLSNGGNGTNDHSFSYTVDSIGMEKAAAIAYRNLTVYLTPTSTFFDARNGAIQAAEDLYGINSTEANAVTDAWCAVGMGTCDGSNIAITTPNGGETLDG